MNKVISTNSGAARIEVVRAAPSSLKIFRDSHKPTSSLPASAATLAKAMAAKRMLVSIGAAC